MDFFFFNTCTFYPAFQPLSSLEQLPADLQPGVCQHLRMPATRSTTQPLEEPLFSTHQCPSSAPLCDVVAQTVKVNHSGLYIYIYT